MSENLNDVGLQSYYCKLNRTERAKLKSYLSSKLGISYFTVDNKFSGRSRWKVAELAMVEPVIESEDWRR